MSRKEVADTMTFGVVFIREGSIWTVIAPNVHPAHSWGRSLETATEHIKEAIALVLDLPKGSEHSIVLDAEYIIDGMRDGAIFGEARDARQTLRDAQHRADETLREAIEHGRKHGLSIRNIATMTDVSYQRVAQISSRSRI